MLVSQITYKGDVLSINKRLLRDLHKNTMLISWFILSNLILLNLQ
jgi:hypothetical protein